MPLKINNMEKNKFVINANPGDIIVFNCFTLHRSEQAKIDKVKIIDSSWHLPQANRDGHSEYKKEHIKNSIFFDIEKYSKKNIFL